MACLSSASTTTDAAAQKQWEHVATPVPGCRPCPAPVPVQDGSSEHPSGSCARVEELLHLVMEVQEEVSR